MTTRARFLSALVAAILAVPAWAGAQEPSPSATEPSPGAPESAQNGQENQGSQDPENDSASESQNYIEERLAELERLRAELERRVAELSGDIEGDELRREALTLELEELTAVVEAVQARHREAQSRLGAVQSEVDAKTKELREAEAELESLRSQLSVRAKTIYKHGPTSIFELAFGATGMQDLFRRAGLLLRLVRVDNDRVADIEAQHELIMQARHQVAQVRNQVAAQAETVRTERDRAASVQRSVDARKGAVAAELESHYAELGDLEEQKAAYAAETELLREESARIAAFLQGQSDSPPTVSPKGMSWPFRGRVTSGYGWRTHPIYGSKRFHAGIDIAGPTGTEIGAAASGTVIFAGPRNGYGNTVIVSHGGDIATLYAHQSAIRVGEGDKVVRGQPVGLVGCTGACTGPHLHFEVRVDGAPDDPMRWLP